MYSKNFYIFIRAVVRLFYSPLKLIKVIGNRTIEKPSIIICNHISLDDPFLIAHALQNEPKYLAKIELFNNKLLANILLKIGCIPINRSKPDMSSMRKCIECIKSGQSLVVFPEGTRKKGERCKKEDAKGGIGLIAASTKADIIPVSIFTKGYKSGIFKRNIVSIGKPIPYEEYMNACDDKRDIGVYAFSFVVDQLIKLEESFGK